MVVCKCVIAGVEEFQSELKRKSEVCLEVCVRPTSH